jgi:hypothetical protein
MGCLYRAGSLVTVSKELSKYKLDRDCRRSDGMEVAHNHQNAHFSTKMGFMHKRIV